MKKILSLLLTGIALASMTSCIIDDGHHHGGHGRGGVRGHEYYKDHSYNQGNHHRGGGHNSHNDHHDH